MYAVDIKELCVMTSMPIIVHMERCTYNLLRLIVKMMMQGFHGTAATFKGIDVGTSKPISLKPRLGLLNQSKYVLLMWGGTVVILNWLEVLETQ